MKTFWSWQPTPAFLPVESHGQRSLAGHGPWGHRESDTTEATKHTRSSEGATRRGKRQVVGEETPRDVTRDDGLACQIKILCE